MMIEAQIKENINKVVKKKQIDSGLMNMLDQKLKLNNFRRSMNLAVDDGTDNSSDELHYEP